MQLPKVESLKIGEKVAEKPDFRLRSWKMAEKYNCSCAVESEAYWACEVNL